MARLTSWVAPQNLTRTTNQNTYFKDLFVIYGAANRTVTETAIPLQGYPVPTVTGSGFNEPVADQADFNGDGKADLVLVEGTQAIGLSSTRKIVVLTGKGNRAFNPEDTLYTDSSGGLDFTVQAIHANSDNKPDILADVFANNSPTANFFLNDTSAWFGGCALPASATGIHLCSPTTYTSTKAAFSLSASRRASYASDGALGRRREEVSATHARLLPRRLPRYHAYPSGRHPQSHSLRRR